MMEEQYKAWKGDADRVTKNQLLGLGHATFKKGETSTRLSASIKEWNISSIWRGRGRTRREERLSGIIIKSVVLDSFPKEVVRGQNGKLQYSIRLDGGEPVALPPGFVASREAPSFSPRPFLAFHETVELMKVAEVAPPPPTYGI